ncbi:putative anti-sigma regulatory factor, serine/threonine protein kinase [Oscillochloris trichoides DG-6]|uniref:Anti-sigma regulatory factor, serine/threonine protein kinase n=1 Tax=Oscillochloris trichoides DG-6 TaxID=765420 RepID=E1ID93_9CHLR|nr:ATP-binding protein [Oscillochloris trichoides]EFO80770.1 putative anti-sigma regulatory factor, serine/threonine protein kinase [Oscillochloris trichoides DG-6]
MELTLPNQLGYELIARDAIAAFARRLGMPMDRVDDMKTALCEACINAIEHGNLLNPDLRVHILCHVDAERFVIEVYDQGLRRFVPPSSLPNIADKLNGTGSLRGMGLLLISQLSDESGFVPRDEAGNCFRFAFQRSGAAHGCR